MVKQKSFPTGLGSPGSFGQGIPNFGSNNPTSLRSENYWDEVELQQQLSERQACAASILPKRPAFLGGRKDINDDESQGGLMNTTESSRPTPSKVDDIIAAHQKYPSFQRSMQPSSATEINTYVNAPPSAANTYGSASPARHGGHEKSEAVDVDVNRILSRLHVEHEGIQQARSSPKHAHRAPLAHTAPSSSLHAPRAARRGASARPAPHAAPAGRPPPLPPQALTAS
jgi:hypothetical protein